ncbi:MAG TPA: LamG domain-containing protein [Candidatus Hydrogenedentes bacterium]|nr:LamG domain-containing protein [Candidatus Hydrogenedentota bacterium]HPG67738.1 LamG domain-containing protein [Candidatus Hydrogenedentota bacterium]
MQRYAARLSLRKPSHRAGLLVIVCVLAALAVAAGSEESVMSTDVLGQDLIGHWPLDRDCRDVSAHGHHGENRGVTFRDGAAWFDGRDSQIIVPDSPSLRIGTQDFSVAAWIRTDEALDDVLGDILGKFDPARRAGINFCIQNFHGVTSGQPNYRNVFFGIDDGGELTVWRDCGRPGNAVMIWALCVYDGALYAATFEAGKEEAGHVYRYDGGDTWTDCGSPYPSNAVTSLAVFDGRLYAAASHYRSAGSALPESENTIPGGRVFRYEGGAAWTDCGRVAEIEGIGGLAVYRGRLYASSLVAPAGLFCYEGGTRWAECGHPGGRVEALAVHNGGLYGSGWDPAFAGVYRYDADGTWTDCGIPEGTTQTYSFAIHGGRMYVGVWPGGKVFRYGGGTAWEDCGRLGEELEVMGMAVYNGKLYAGTLPLASVFRYDGDGRWTDTGRLDRTPDVKYRRVWSMAVFDGKLFCGVLPSGHVHAFEAGRCVSVDRELPSGWAHVAATRSGASLNLFINGQLAAASEASGLDALDLSNTQPLTIGFGAHDYFNGALRDVRLYGRALDAEEVVCLASQPKERTE